MDEVVSIAQPHLNIYEGLYQEVNPGGLPTIGAGEAAAFLKRSNLNPQILGQIWEIADYQKRGCLDRRGVFMALKLIAAAQQGHPIQPVSIHLSSLNPPIFAQRPGSAAGSIHSQNTTPTHSAETMGGWAIGPVDQAKYDSIFTSLSPVDGKLPGAKVRPVLLNSGLNPTNLAKIWELADQDKDGQLDRIEMAVALHLVYRALQNEPVPGVLPASLTHPSKAHLSRRSSTASYTGSTQKLSQQFNQTSFGGMGNAARSRTGSMVSLDGIGMSSAPLSSQIPTDRSVSAQPYPTRNMSISSQSATPTHGPSTPLSSDWPVDRFGCAAQFAACDSDSDGIVNGADVRHVLINTGLPQQALAHIWELADVNKNGTLNHEQFALVIHLINMTKRGEELPRTLPAQLVPPSLRQLRLNENGLAGSQLSLSSVSIDQATKSENAEIRALGEEMERLLTERREADAQVVQLEADMTVKNSAIKNLQIELQTLEGTVKQLDRQKTEAGRRLGDLDEQIRQLKAAGEAQAAKGSDTTARLEQLKKDAEEGAASVERDHAAIAEARAELANLEAEGKNLAAQITSEQKSVEQSIDEMTRAERECERDEKQRVELEAESEKLRNMMTELQSTIDCEDASEQLKTKLPLLANQEKPSLLQDGPIGVPSTSSQNSFAQPPDPFAGTQSGLAHVDPFAHADPFAGTGSSGAAFSAGFPSDPFSDGANSTAFGGSSQPPPSSTVLKAPPPRPAPPKTSQTPVQDDPFSNVDPFAAQPTSSVAGGFADFDSFSAFN